MTLRQFDMPATFVPFTDTMNQLVFMPAASAGDPGETVPRCFRWNKQPVWWGVGGLKALNVTAWAGASTASAGPGVG